MRVERSIYFKYFKSEVDKMTRVYEITNDTLNVILDKASELGLEIDCYEDVLNDNYIIPDVDNKIKIECKTCRHIIVRVSFLNEWSSSLTLYMTDSDEVLNRHVEELEEQYKEW